MAIHAILLASGEGERANHFVPKQFAKIAGKMVIEHTLDIIQRSPLIDEIIIVVHPSYRALVDELISTKQYPKVKKLLDGGASRSESSRIGVSSIANNNDYVLIHDAVRPFLSNQIIERCVSALKIHPAVDVAIPSADTIIQVNQNNLIENIPDRAQLRRGQTPQAFHVGIIKRAHALAAKDLSLKVTDDCSLILKYKLADVYVVPGEERNLKITYQEDIFLAEKLMQLKSLDVPESVSLDSLKDLVIVVFGASRGIGASIVQVSKLSGARIYGFSRTNNVNIGSIKEVELALEQVAKAESRIDYVINTAASLKVGTLESRSIADIRAETETNFLGAINIVKASLPYLKQSKGGVILFTSSSYTRGRASYATYSAIKAAIVNLVQALSEELRPDGIRINAINPGRTATPMRIENFGIEPPKELLDPEIVARATLKTLLSDLSGAIVDVRRNEINKDEP